MAQLPKPLTDLPKPELDLPLPEKDLPAHNGSASKGVAFRSYGTKLPFPRYVFLGIVFVALITIVGGAYFLGRNSVFKELNPSNPVPPPADPVIYVSPNPDPTANWKTYSSVCGFVVNYPPSWKAEKFFTVGSDDSCAYITSDKYDSGLDSRDGFYIGIKKRNISENEYLKEVENSTGSYIPVANKRNRTIGGQSGLSFEPAGYDLGTEFIFTQNTSLYIINWPTEIEAENLTYIESIISSIKFL